MNPFINFLTVVLILNLGGCGDAKSPQTSKSTLASQISGIVLREEEPVSQGQIEAKDRGGQKVAQGQWVSENHYTLTLPAGTVYPVVITVLPSGNAESLKAALVSPGNLTQDITSTTSKLVDNAMVLGVMVRNLPPDLRKKALFYGILGAYVLRGLALVFAAILIEF